MTAHDELHQQAEFEKRLAVDGWLCNFDVNFREFDFLDDAMLEIGDRAAGWLAGEALAPPESGTESADPQPRDAARPPAPAPVVGGRA